MIFNSVILLLSLILTKDRKRWLQTYSDNEIVPKKEINLLVSIFFIIFDLSSKIINPKTEIIGIKVKYEGCILGLSKNIKQIINIKKINKVIISKKKILNLRFLFILEILFASSEPNKNCQVCPGRV